MLQETPLVSTKHQVWWGQKIKFLVTKLAVMVNQACHEVNTRIWFKAVATYITQHNQYDMVKVPRQEQVHLEIRESVTILIIPVQMDIKVATRHLHLDICKFINAWMVASQESTLTKIVKKLLIENILTVRVAIPTKWQALAWTTQTAEPLLTDSGVSIK